MRALAVLILALALAGCQNYQDFWADYDKSHATCRSSAPDSITGSVDTRCPAPGQPR